MFGVKVNGVEYFIPQKWEEVSFQEYARFMKCATAPENKSEELIWQREVLFALSNIPEEYKKSYPVGDVKAGFEILMDMIPEGFPAEPKREFEYQGVIYKCPEDRVTITGDIIPMGTTTVEEFLESEALEIGFSKVKDQELAAIAQIVAILFRPENEEYNEGLCSVRAKQFMSAPCVEIMNAYFFLGTLLGGFKTRLNLFLQEANPNPDMKNIQK